MHTDKTHAGLTEVIIGSAFEVMNLLGPGFLEKIYERALRHELQIRGLRTESEVHYPVRYKGKPLGDYVADLVVENAVIVELKCVRRLASEHLAQCINYLRASRLTVALLINFERPKLEWKRVLLD